MKDRILEMLSHWPHAWEAPMLPSRTPLFTTPAVAFYNSDWLSFLGNLKQMTIPALEFYCFSWAFWLELVLVRAYCFTS